MKYFFILQTVGTVPVGRVETGVMKPGMHVEVRNRLVLSVLHKNPLSYLDISL